MVLLKSEEAEVSGEGKGGYEVVMDRDALAKLEGKPEKFVEGLRGKGVIKG